MREFNYIRARSLGDAVKAIADAGDAGRLIAGGTDLLIELRRPEGKVCDTLVDISCVKDLEGVRLENDTIHIGPLTTHTALI